MMEFNVSQLLREPVGSTRQYSLEPEEPVRGGAVELMRTPTGVLVRATADVVLDAACSRCLAPFGYPARVVFEELYYQRFDPVTGERLNTDVDPESFFIDARNTIDIREAVRQYGEMAAEMQPLCRPDCPGLCAECGQDLNLGQCSCGGEFVDPRWIALEALRHR
jgi:uncharacterized protein